MSTSSFTTYRKVTGRLGILYRPIFPADRVRVSQTLHFDIFRSEFSLMCFIVKYVGRQPNNPQKMPVAAPPKGCDIVKRYCSTTVVPTRRTRASDLWRMISGTPLS